MPTVNTPYMNLTLPVVTQEQGPQYAQDINGAFSQVDQHNHTQGQGVQIPSQGINIQSDLTLNINNLTNSRTVRFVSTTASSGTDIGCVYVKGGDLFFNDLSGNVVRLTQGGGVATTGIFAGNISTTAIISANAGTPATSGFIRMINNTDFVSWRNAANTADDRVFFDSSDNFQVLGNVNGGVQTYGVRLVDQVGGKVVYVNAANSTSAYTLSSPAQPTSSTAPVFMQPTGVLASSTVSGGHVSNNINLPGNAIQAGGKNVIVSNTNPPLNLAFLRGGVNSNGTTNGGEGYSSSKESTGSYHVIFTTAFGDMPTVVACPGTGPGVGVYPAGVSTTAMFLETFNTATAGAQDFPSFFFVFAQRT